MKTRNVTDDAMSCEHWRRESSTVDDDKKTKLENAYRPWAPGGYVAFRLLLASRMCAALWSNISDCDETYNYWEPVSEFF